MFRDLIVHSAAILIFVALNVGIFVSCGEGDDKTSRVRVTWNANRENAVNRPGGGYLVYYSRNQGFSIDDSDVLYIDVPYRSGKEAPTSTELDLNAKKWHIKVIAYTGIGGGSISSASNQIEIDLDD